MGINVWSLVRFLHVISAMFWVGGQLLLSGVVLPVARAQLEPSTRSPLMRTIAKRFGLVSNFVALPFLLASGLALAFHRGVSLGSFSSPGYGRLLTIKLVLVLVSIVLAALHGILSARNPKAARSLAMTGLASSVGIVVFATALVP